MKKARTEKSDTLKALEELKRFSANSFNGYEERLKTLHIERDAAERARDEAIVRAGMPKIVTKEVFPWWLRIPFYCLALFEIFYFAFVFDQLRALQIPIREPYVPESVSMHVNVLHDLLDHRDLQIKACQAAWRADEKEIRRLKKEIK